LDNRPTQALEAKPQSPMNPSISVIIHTGNGAGPTERLLDSFIATNTHDPVELIVVHRSIPKKIAGVVAGFATRAFIRQVQADPDDSFGVACAAAASRAMSSHLLFLSDTSIFNQDVLPRVLPKLLESHDTLVGLQFMPTPNICRRKGDGRLCGSIIRVT
jgi:hypothetical protein